MQKEINENNSGRVSDINTEKTWNNTNESAVDGRAMTRVMV